MTFEILEILVVVERVVADCVVFFGGSVEDGRVLVCEPR